MRAKIRNFTIPALLFIMAANVHAIDLSLTPGGFGFFPGGEGGDRYEIGGGGGLGFDIDIASVLPNPLGIGYTVGIEGSILYSQNADFDGSFQFFSYGGSLGLYYFPLARLPIRVDGAIGAYNALYTDVNNETSTQQPGMFLRFGGETGFRFSPSFTLTAGAGWRQYKNPGSEMPLNEGIYAGLGIRLTFEAGNPSQGGTGAALTQDDAVYPVLTPLYQQYPIGTVRIRNQENAEIRNVRLFFRAGSNTSSEYPSGTVAIIPKGRSVEMPLYADFSQEILRFADSGRILGEIVIRYTFLGRERETVRTVSVAMHHRNSVPQGDDAAIAAFVSPISPEVLQYSKFISGMARQNNRMGLNSAMQMGIWLFEGIKAAGIKLEETNADDVQFPSQTLAYGSGSPRDIALLYAASMEAAGVRSGIILLPDGGVLGAVNLGITPNSASTAALFNGTDKLLLTGDEVWLPVAISKLSEGFTAAWREGIRLMDALHDGDSAQMVIIEDAWGYYPPVSFPALDVRITAPDSAALAAGANAALQSYISSEFPPARLAEIQRQIQARPSATLYVQLGNMQMRSGNMAQAKSTFEQAAGLGSVGAMVNRGNIALNENDIAGAERWFRQALAREPQNATALRGIEFVEVRK